MATYISLFSSAGIGCYGFQIEGFECVATSELIPRRIKIQEYNSKCKYASGYICGDLSQASIKEKLYSQVDLWRKKENIERIDTIIATPPCQGMSVANHKKSNTEIIRNSLVVESIKIIKKLFPKFFIFENVPSFMKTICTDIDNKDKPIAEAIQNNLSQMYSYSYKTINFKDYGACSSRKRTLVIGVAKDLADIISPIELFPTFVSEKTLRETIGDLKSLSKIGEIDSKDIYHSFRRYPEYMRQWITNLNEGESAFDNTDEFKKPHRIINGKLVLNKRKNGDKYKRQVWDKVGPCVHTRNDQLASQNTIHPKDDRVFSIRELMLMMTVPQNFKWCKYDLKQLNQMSLKEKQAYLKKDEIKIRQALGEAVPTIIFQDIAKKMNNALKYSDVGVSDIKKIIASFDLEKPNELLEFIKSNPLKLHYSILGRIAELVNSKREMTSAFYTNKSLITEVIQNIPESPKKVLRILEPSVGVGNFIPLIIKKFEDKEVFIDAIDIDMNSLIIFKELMKYYSIPTTIHINIICDDFLFHKFNTHYDYIIGNPPFGKVPSKDGKLKIYKRQAENNDTSNICSFFLDRAQKLGNYISLILPKSFLSSPEFFKSRQYLNNFSIECIIDFGEKGFKGVLIETIALLINNTGKKNKTKVVSLPKQLIIYQKQSYIFDNQFPYWIIYRNCFFDKVCSLMTFNLFSVFRDRQITTKMLKTRDGIWVIKSRNIVDDGSEMIMIPGYDSFIDESTAKKLSVYQFLNNDNVYLVPNMSYRPRVIKKPLGTLVNGSVAVLIPKKNIVPTDIQLKFFSSKIYRDFYQIARNYQTRSLNIDKSSVFFFGLIGYRDRSNCHDD